MGLWSRLLRRWAASPSSSPCGGGAGVFAGGGGYRSTPPPSPLHLFTSSPLHLLPTDLSMMRRALDLARQAAALGEVPIGAVVYETQTGRILGEGFNRREIDKDPAAHAEVFAIRAAAKAAGDWRLNHCSLAVTLEPCPMCAGLIVNARLGRLLYGSPDPKAGAAGSLFSLTTDPRLNHRVEPIAGVLQDESAALLKEFFRALRSRPS